MANHFDLIIRGATCVSQDGVGEADLGVNRGRTAAIGNLSQATSEETLDASGLHLFPGVIDTQVHFREPGGEHKEDMESGSRAAVLGGVTAVFDMPNTDPPATTPELFTDKLTRAERRMWCDYAFYVGASPENLSNLSLLERLRGCCGIKVFMGSSTGDLLIADDKALETVLRSGRRRIAVHCEDNNRLDERADQRKPGQPETHNDWRDPQTALLATQRLLNLARVTRRRVHVLHVSTAEEMALLAEYRDVATTELTPQHLTLEAPDCYQRLGTRAQMNPPIREQSHREILWAGVAAGIVDIVGSDHAPHTIEEKEQTYPDSPSGMPGVQTLFPLMLTHAAEGRLTLQRVADLTSAGPARVFGIATKGRLAVGYDADFTLADLGEEREITQDWLASKCGWSPFEGFKAKGWPKATVIRGNVVRRDGELAETPTGAPLRFLENLKG